ncbi:hypothetical protein KJZ99_01985, partial [bacterium]|nr:hypothetical protein [bacterium]
AEAFLAEALLLIVEHIAGSQAPAEAFLAEALLLIVEHIAGSQAPAEAFLAEALLLIVEHIAGSQAPEAIDAFFVEEHAELEVIAALLVEEHLETSQLPEALVAEALEASQPEVDAAFEPEEVKTALVAACSVAEFLAVLLAFLLEEQALSHA